VKKVCISRFATASHPVTGKRARPEEVAGGLFVFASFNVWREMKKSEKLFEGFKGFKRYGKKLPENV
jgi:hypothetical protein